ncbi:MAG: exodeoxyribonuclease III [Gammaproteobacteria bacterium]
MKIATWNVNSLRTRLAHLDQWLAGAAPDVLALQETKVVDGDFPSGFFESRGYRVAFSGQKSYNGVAVASRVPMTVLMRELPGLDDPQRRVLAVEAGGATIVNLYVPNGSAIDSEKYQYKLRWLDSLIDCTRGLLGSGRPTVLLGDFNIAPADCDVHDPKAWEGGVLVSAPERERLERLMDIGLVDCFRALEPDGGGFTWWDYRAAAFRRNLGLRIDLILADRAFASHCRECLVDTGPRRLEKPSDHAPVLARFETPFTAEAQVPRAGTETGSG